MYTMDQQLPDLSGLKVGGQRPTVAHEPPSQPPPHELSAPDMDYEGLPEDSGTLAAPPPAKSAETIAKEEELRIIISLYKVKFGEDLAVLGAEIDPVNMSQMDLPQLELLRDRCDKLLGAGSGCENKKRAFNTCLYVIEKLGCYGGAHLEGLTATLLADKEYQRDITRLALRYLSANDCRPEYTVPMKILTTAVQIHMNNELTAQKQVVEAKLTTGAAAQKIGQVNTKYQDNIA